MNKLLLFLNISLSMLHGDIFAMQQVQLSSPDKVYWHGEQQNINAVEKTQSEIKQQVESQQSSTEQTERKYQIDNQQQEAAMSDDALYLVVEELLAILEKSNFGENRPTIVWKYAGASTTQGLLLQIDIRTNPGQKYYKSFEGIITPWGFIKISFSNKAQKEEIYIEFNETFKRIFKIITKSKDDDSFNFNHEIISFKNKKLPQAILRSDYNQGEKNRLAALYSLAIKNMHKS